MKYIESDDRYVVTIARGERIIEEITRLCVREGIRNAKIEGIGAVDKAELAHYSVADKKYTPFRLREPLEVVSLLGNVFLGQEALIVHLHAVMGKADGELVGGHLVEARVSGACEVVITTLGTLLHKEYDEETGLKLLQM